MATYNFSTLSSGQAIAFDPNADILHFNQTTISAASINYVALDGSVRIAVRAGADAGKFVDLVGMNSMQIATSNMTFANGSRFVIGNGTVAPDGLESNTIVGFGGHDFINGWSGNDSLNGGSGNDWLEGSGGMDTLSGSGGQDSFAFNELGAGAGPDVLTDFASGWDNLQFNVNNFDLGTVGRFSAGDARFWSATGATAGHDADDRLIFNTTTRELWYDADGSGAGASLLVLRLSNTSSISATDIWAFRPAGLDAPPPPPPPPPGPEPINGGPGNDSLVGTANADTLNGMGGNDTLVGLEGADGFSGGDGNDLLDGRNHRHGDWDDDAETMDGGLGNDTFHVDNPGDVITDSGGVDTVVAHNMEYTLPGGFENLAFNNGQADGGGPTRGTGNGLDNLMDGTNGPSPADGWFVWFGGLAGNDTLLGGMQNDTLEGGEGNDSLDGDWDYDTLAGGAGNDTLYGGLDEHQDTIAGGAGADVFLLSGPGSSFFAWDEFIDFTSGVDDFHLDGEQFPSIGASGAFGAGDDRFVAAAAAQDAEDRVIWDGDSLWYDADGTGSEAMERIAALQPGATVVATDIFVFNGTEPPPPPGTNDTIFGTSGNDTLSGGPGNDSVNGGGGNDWVLGGTGNDTLSGSGGQDAFVFGERGAADADRINDFASGWDSIRFDDVGFSSIGTVGRFSSSDARFWAAPGASQGHDATDRVVFNTTTKELWYDRDGLGGAGAELIVTLQGTANVVAGDIYVI